MTANQFMCHQTCMSFISNWLGSTNGLTTGSVSLFSIFVNPFSQPQVQAEAIIPPTQNQQITKSIVYSCCAIKYSTLGGVSWQIQHSASPRAVFATRPHPSCCMVSYNTRNGGLASI